MNLDVTAARESFETLFNKTTEPFCLSQMKIQQKNTLVSVKEERSTNLYQKFTYTFISRQNGHPRKTEIVSSLYENLDRIRQHINKELKLGKFEIEFDYYNCPKKRTHQSAKNKAITKLPIEIAEKQLFYSVIEPRLKATLETLGCDYQCNNNHIRLKWMSSLEALYPLPKIPNYEDRKDVTAAQIYYEDYCAKKGDVLIICEDDEKVLAHSAILSVASPFFRAMFSNPMKEKQTKEIQVPFPSTIVKDILEFLYNGTNFLATGNNMAEIIELAHQWAIASAFSEGVRTIAAHHDPKDKDQMKLIGKLGNFFSHPLLVKIALFRLLRMPELEIDQHFIASKKKFLTAFNKIARNSKTNINRRKVNIQGINCVAFLDAHRKNDLHDTYSFYSLLESIREGIQKAIQNGETSYTVKTQGDYVIRFNPDSPSEVIIDQYIYENQMLPPLKALLKKFVGTVKSNADGSLEISWKTENDKNYPLPKTPSISEVNWEKKFGLSKIEAYLQKDYSEQHSTHVEIRCSDDKKVSVHNIPGLFTQPVINLNFKSDNVSKALYYLYFQSLPCPKEFLVITEINKIQDDWNSLPLSEPFTDQLELLQLAHLWNLGKLRARIIQQISTAFDASNIKHIHDLARVGEEIEEPYLLKLCAVHYLRLLGAIPKSLSTTLKKFAIHEFANASFT